MARRRRVFAAGLDVALAVTFAACGVGEPTGGRPVVRDSAGIRIVESGAVGAWGEDGGWAVEPAVSIGQVEGPEEYTFNRIADLAVSPAGRVYVLDANDRLVKVYDADGVHITTFGGRGRGPAEFQGPARLALRGDTVVVYDYNLLKLAYFTADGELLHTVPAHPSLRALGFPSLFEAVPDGFVVVLTTGCRLPAPEDRRPQWSLVTVGPDGVIRDTLMRRVNSETLAIYGERFCTIVPALATPSPRLAVAADSTTAFGDGARYEIRISRGRAAEAARSADGAPPPDRILRRRIDPTPVTAAHIDEYRRRYDGKSLGDRVDPDYVQAVQAAWDSIGFAATWPAFDALLRDDDGHLWVRRAAPAGLSTRTWDVFDPEGRFLGPVELPAGLTVHAIALGTVWGVERDEFDVQYVKGYRRVR